ncbi:hypothetical protein HOT31_gp033 [Microbacterium phage Hendrix]|uniref:Uncharacterized protein n=1 Tax=Microbacterium phage Hendrix TaxID=2182341 RepID=A0A2U8UU64_9CAUD|nr:hypothetical protein HOT31_gp033 [Microbacterium phage Hendrix]AWN07704.1 hypothetical protein PBI_HENDRIX_33 [Microbacterium phage Hendrix]
MIRMGRTDPPTLLCRHCGRLIQWEHRPYVRHRWVHYETKLIVCLTHDTEALPSSTEVGTVVR